MFKKTGVLFQFYLVTLLAASLGLQGCTIKVKRGVKAAATSTTPTPTPTPQAAPLDPTGFAATPSSSSVALTWTSGGGTTADYRIAYQTGATAPATCALGTTISEANISGTSKTVSGLTPSTQYSFRVCAINSNGTPDVSSGDTVTTTTTAGLPAITATFPLGKNKYLLQSMGQITFDSSGNMYVVDGAYGQIQKIDSSGNLVFKFGSFGVGDGQFSNPSGVAVDGSGNIYVSDTGNHRIQKFDLTGTFLLKWGPAGAGMANLMNPNRFCLNQGIF